MLQNDGEPEVVVQRQQYRQYQNEYANRRMYKHFVQKCVVFNFFVAHNLPFFLAAQALLQDGLFHKNNNKYPNDYWLLKQIIEELLFSDIEQVNFLDEPMAFLE